jgi:YtkA-like
MESSAKTLEGIQIMRSKSFWIILAIALVMGIAAFAYHIFGPSPPGVDTATTRVTDKGLYVVAIAPEHLPFERNVIHTWIVEIKDKVGNPVDHATFKVGGGMPRHGHGLPTQPEMTAELGQGKYRIDGVRFHMFGWWEFSFDIDAPQGKDRIVFNLNL